MSLPISGIREVPNNVIEARSEMVDDLSSEHGKTKWDRTASVIFNCLSDRLLILIANDGVLAFLKKPLDLSLKIDDVLVGPL